jgi:phosphoglucosamine mutase
VLKNVSYLNEDPLNNNDVKKAIEESDKIMGTDGRILIRKSGTEPLIRVMAEGKDRDVVNKAVNDVVNAIKIAVGE